MEHENTYRSKALRGRYFVATDDVRGSKSWECFRQKRFKEGNRKNDNGSTRTGFKDKEHQESHR